VIKCSAMTRPHSREKGLCHGVDFTEQRFDAIAISGTVGVVLMLVIAVSPAWSHSAHGSGDEGWTPFGFGPRRVPTWFREAKLGMFVHWGPVSQVGQELSYPLLCCPLDDMGCDGAVSCVRSLTPL
jgi:hypothetical protein